MVSLSSAEETIMWLDFAKDLKYVELERIGYWQQELAEICKMLHKLREKIDV